MKIVYLDHQTKSITGGHKYNDAFLNYLSNYANKKIIKTPCCAELYQGWRKIYSPFAELIRLKVIRRDCLVFWGDTTFKYHFLLALFSKIFKKPKSVIIIHHFSYLGEKGIKRWLSFCIQYLYILLCGDIIVPSPYTLSVAKAVFPRKIIHYIPLPFKRVFSVSEKYNVGEFLYVGTIEERKGLMYLIEALGLILKENPNYIVKLNIVGKVADYSFFQKLVNRINDLGLQNMVDFCGRVSDEELKTCQEKAEIFTFPSLLEGYGIVLVEAMSKGIPVIAFNNSAIPYTIEDGVNGLLAENKSVSSLASKILLLSGNSTLRCKLQEGMKKTIDSLKTRGDFEKGIQEFYDQFKGI